MTKWRSIFKHLSIINISLCDIKHWLKWTIWGHVIYKGDVFKELLNCLTQFRLLHFVSIGYRHQNYLYCIFVHLVLWVFSLLKKHIRNCRGKVNYRTKNQNILFFRIKHALKLFLLTVFDFVITLQILKILESFTFSKEIHGMHMVNN